MSLNSIDNKRQEGYNNNYRNEITEVNEMRKTTYICTIKDSSKKFEVFYDAEDYLFEQGFAHTKTVGKTDYYEKDGETALIFEHLGQWQSRRSDIAEHRGKVSEENITAKVLKNAGIQLTVKDFKQAFKLGLIPLTGEWHHVGNKELNFLDMKYIKANINYEKIKKALEEIKIKKSYTAFVKGKYTEFEKRGSFFKAHEYEFVGKLTGNWIEIIGGSKKKADGNNIKFEEISESEYLEAKKAHETKQAAPQAEIGVEEIISAKENMIRWQRIAALEPTPENKKAAASAQRDYHIIKKQESKK